MGYRKHYSRADARNYYRAKEADRVTHEAECRVVERAFKGVAPGEAVLDLPCGAGRMTEVLAARGFQVTAADVSAPMLEIAHQRLTESGREVRRVLCDAENAGLRGGSFGTVFCFRLFHHLPDQELRRKVVGELCRMAAHRVVLSYQTVHSFTHWKRRWLRWWQGRPMTRFYTSPRAVADLFEERGFRVEREYARFRHSLRVVVAERRRN